MKICYIVDAHTVLSQRIAEYFANKDNEILIVCFVSKHPNTHKKIKVKELGIPKKYLKIPYSEHLDNILKVKNEVSRFDPDIVHGHYVSTIASHVMMIDKKYPLLMSAWGSDILIDAGSKHHRLLIKKALNYAGRVTSVASHVTDVIIGMGIPGEKISTFTFGADTTVFQPGIKTEKLRAELELNDDDKVIISTRMLEPVYDHSTLIKAMVTVLKKESAAKLIVVGSGSLEEKLKSQVEEAGIGGSVQFTGFVDYDRLPYYLNLADVYVSTSRSDGTSISLLEAMACGTFPVVSDLQANRDWISNKKNGLLFGVGDAGELAEMIVGVLNEPDMVEKAVKINIEKVKARGDWFTNMKELERIYHSLQNSK